MKALTIWQPHATMLAIRLRTIETRGWSTSYRGPLLIHAAKKWDESTAEDCSIAGEQVRAASVNLDEDERDLGHLPWRETLGCVIAVANLWDCVPIPVPCGTEWDRAWGGFGPGRWGWRLRVNCVLRQPVPARGAQGLWVPGLDLLHDVELSS